MLHALKYKIIELYRILWFNTFVKYNIKIYRTYYKPDQLLECISDNIYNYVEPVDTTVFSYQYRELNEFWSEYMFFKHIWQNGKKSKYIGFDQHARRISEQTLSRLNYSYPYYRTLGRFDETIYEQYVQNHYKEDIDNVLQILQRKYGADNPYSKYIVNGHDLFYRSCFVMSWKCFDELCRFIFSVLDELDSDYGLNFDYDSYQKKYGDCFRQKRAFGFLAERLLSAFLVVNFGTDIVQHS